MKLSISNIAWNSLYDNAIYNYLQESSYSGVEIAPTKIFAEDPYGSLQAAKDFSVMLKTNYGLEIPSLQSIWFGRNERIFGSEEERNTLIEYTQKAVLFAEAVGAKNLVFGCPKNRVSNAPDDMETALEFFHKLGEFALKHGAVIAMEANPVIYNTNFINTTKEAFEIVRQVNSEGFKLNLDTGTMIYYEEGISVLDGNMVLINHVHISEPGLKIIEKRGLHQELKKCLLDYGYSGFVSIEMANQEDLSVIKSTLSYVKSVFG